MWKLFVRNDMLLVARKYESKYWNRKMLQLLWILWNEFSFTIIHCKLVLRDIWVFEEVIKFSCYFLRRIHFNVQLNIKCKFAWLHWWWWKSYCYRLRPYPSVCLNASLDYRLFFHGWHFVRRDIICIYSKTSRITMLYKTFVFHSL